MKREELISFYSDANIYEKWNLIKKTMEQEITEICPWRSKDFQCFARRQKVEAFQNKRYLKLIWHYLFRRIPLLAPIIGRKYLPTKNKEYYQYRTWYYEYLEPVIDIRDNFLNYEKIFELLSDEISKAIYCDVLMARITRSNKYYSEGYDKSKEYPQYFALDILPEPNPRGVFVDCGGYIGDTAERFIKYYSEKYKYIYVYEPDAQNAFKAKEALKDYHDIYIRQYGVGKENKMFFFNSTGTASSVIQKSGTTEVKVVSLDADVEVPITFIKMDIEGEESNAIIGAEKHIKCDKPVCVVCLYHKIQDIWKLPLQIISINPDYKLYLRHYTENYMETVAYLV